MVSLVVTPILVAGLGSTLFGVWQILNRLISYMTAADGRPNHALKWVIANYQGSDDTIAKRRAVGNALGVWLLLLPLLLGVGTVLAWFSPIFAKVPPELSNLVRVTSSLLVLNLALGVLASVPEAVLRGMNLGYKRMGVVASLNVLGGTLTAAAIHLGWGLLGLAIAQVIVTVMTAILFWRLVRVYVHWFGIERVPFDEIRQFLRLSIWYGAWDVVNKLLLINDVIILGWLISASAVTNYVLTGYAANTLLIGVSTMLSAAVPGLGSLIGARKYARVIALREEMLLTSSLFAGVLGAVVLLWNRSFVTLWVGDEHYAGMWVNLFLVLMAVQLLLIRNDTYLIDLTLNVRRKVILGFVSFLISSSIAVVLAPFLGVMGLCLGILLGRLVLTLAYPTLTGTFLGSSLPAQLRPLLRPGLLMGALFVVSAYIGRSHQLKSGSI